MAFIACLLHTPGCHQNRHNLRKEINHILVILIVLGKFCLSILGTACFSRLHHRLQKQEKLYFCTRKPKTKKPRTDVCMYTHTHTQKYACGHVELIHFKTAVCIKFLFFFWQILKNVLIKCSLFSLMKDCNRVMLLQPKPEILHWTQCQAIQSAHNLHKY